MVLSKTILTICFPFSSDSNWISINRKRPIWKLQYFLNLIIPTHWNQNIFLVSLKPYGDQYISVELSSSANTFRYKKSKFTSLSHRCLQSSQVPDARVFRFGRGDASKVLGHVVADTAAERVVIFTSRVLQVVVTLVVEHLVGGQVHGGIEQLRKEQ